MSLKIFETKLTSNALEKLINNNEHIESPSVEIIRKNHKNIILSGIYRLPRGGSKYLY